MSIISYIENIAKRYALGNATEHTFRGDLQRLIEELVADVAATNEPKRIDCGAPDYVITRKEVAIGYIEAKDVGKDLGAKEFNEQFGRYREALDNLVITDYLDFRFYVNGLPTAEIKIAEVRNGRIVPLVENFEQFTSLLKEFCSRTPITIKSSKKLAEMMADKAKLLAYVIKNALESDDETHENSTLKEQMKAFKDILIHDIDARSFADIYAQTIAYGMFAARLHDRQLDTFSRQEAAEKIPKTNPFLRKLFQYVAGYDLDDRIIWIVDALADVFRAADVAAILKNFGRSTQTHDPIMHFYETFLAEYDPKLRKSRGVFYTPEPVVDFIVRAVDDILKSEFNLPAGLADTSKTKITVEEQGKKVEREVHKVQILDPATGTGTFLAQVIKQIYKGFENQKGAWPRYVDEHLIPRLNGFELLMASYAMAHLKLDLLLSELSVTELQSCEGSESENFATSQPRNSATRFQIYLTNALEEYHPDTGTLFASWLSTEANEANHIKRDTPVMVVIGNPPYSGESANKGKWIMSLMEDYKKEPGGGKLKEQNAKWLNDDYVKFIRYAQHFIENNQEGILAFITNNGYLDNPTFRGMRYNLLKSFNTIYSIDLHGSAKKQEKASDGTQDKNVFDIQQGVSIILAVKRRNNSQIAKVKSFDLLGTREQKYQFLLGNSLSTVDFVEASPSNPNYLFKKVDESTLVDYNSGFNVISLFSVNVMGFQTHRDHFCIDDDKNLLVNRLRQFSDSDLSEMQLEAKYDIRTTSDFNVLEAKHELGKRSIADEVTKCLYRPFDQRFILFDRLVVDRPRTELTKHINGKNNILIGFGRQGIAVGDIEWCLTTVSRNPVDANVFRRGGVNLCPLYLYPSANAQQSLDGKTERVPNLNSEIVDKIAAGIGLAFVPEKVERVSSPHVSKGSRPAGDALANQKSLTAEGALTNVRATDTATPAALDTEATFAPIDILDYIYAVLHSPAYREKYKEFLKIDFPRVPYPKEAAVFWRLVALGGELRAIHLLESPKVARFITKFPVGGDNLVEKIAFLSEPRAVATGFLDLDTEKNPVAIAPGTDPANPAAAGADKIGRVYFNSTQYFENVPETSWNFYIGGYQPAQKWLKDRKGRHLSYDDIQHYQKIILALTETDRLMKEINKINFLEIY